MSKTYNNSPVSANAFITKQFFVDTIFSKSESTKQTSDFRKEIENVYDDKISKMYILPDLEYNLLNSNHFKFKVFHGFKNVGSFEIKAYTVLFENEKLISISEILYELKLKD